MAVHSKVLTCSCYELGHTWEPSCWKAILDVSKAGYKASFNIYAPLYLIAALLKRRKKDYYLKKILPEILRSTFFLGTNAFFFISTFCFWRNIAGCYFYLNVLVCGIPTCALASLIERRSSLISRILGEDFLNGRALLGKFHQSTVMIIPSLCGCFLSILQERKSRRGLLAVYVANLATETMWNMAVSRGYVSPIKNGEVLFFSVVAAVYMYLFRSKNGLSRSISSGISFVVGDSECGSPVEVPKALGESERSRHSTPEKELHGPIVSWLPKEVQEIIARWRQGRRHPLCQHRYSCLASVVEQGVWVGGAGVAIQSVIRILSAIPHLLRGRFSTLISGLKRKDNFTFGLFLGSFAAIFKAMSCLLRWVREKDSSFHGFLAGFVAGWSMLCYRSSAIAMYLASKLGEILYFKGIESGYLPYFKWADVILYTVSTSIIFHVAVFEPHNLRPAYWRFLMGLTDGKIGMMNRKLLDVYGTEASKMFPGFVPNYDPRYTNLATASKIIS